MKIFIWIFILFYIQFSIAGSENISRKESARVELIRKLADKNLYKLSAAEIKIKVIKLCAEDRELKLTLNCDDVLGVRSFIIIGEDGYENLTKVIFNDAVGCFPIIDVLKSALGKPSEISPGQCNAKWEFGKNSKYKKVRVFASIYAPPSGKKIEFTIGSEQGDD